MRVDQCDGHVVGSFRRSLSVIFSGFEKKSDTYQISDDFVTVLDEPDEYAGRVQSAAVGQHQAFAFVLLDVRHLSDQTCLDANRFYKDRCGPQAFSRLS